MKFRDTIISYIKKASESKRKKLSEDTINKIADEYEDAYSNLFVLGFEAASTEDAMQFEKDMTALLLNLISIPRKYGL